MRTFPKFTAEQIAALRAEAKQPQERGWYAKRARELGISRSYLSQIISTQKHGTVKWEPETFNRQTYAARIWAKIA